MSRHVAAGSRGELSERQLVSNLLDLMREHGFGRVPQICAQIEDIWRNPERVEKYQKEKDDHLDFMASTAVELPKMKAKGMA